MGPSARPPRRGDKGVRGGPADGTRRPNDADGDRPGEARSAPRADEEPRPARGRPDDDGDVCIGLDDDDRGTRRYRMRGIPRSGWAGSGRGTSSPVPPPYPPRAIALIVSVLVSGAASFRKNRLGGRASVA